MKHLLPILCLFGFMFSDTIYLKDTFGNNKTIYNVDYLGYKDDTIYFQKGGKEIAFNYDDINKIIDDDNNRINPYKKALTQDNYNKNIPNKKRKKNIPNKKRKRKKFDSAESLSKAGRLLISSTILQCILIDGINRGSFDKSEVSILSAIGTGLYLSGFVSLIKSGKQLNNDLNKLSNEKLVNPNAPMTKEEAIKKLEEAKKFLDLELISKEKYDALKKELTPIIIN